MFAHTSAATVAVPSTKALPVSVRRNSRSAVRLCHTVRPENGDPDEVSAASAGAGSGAVASLTPASHSSPNHREKEFYPERPVDLPPPLVSAAHRGRRGSSRPPGG